MKISKYIHSCLLLEKQGFKLLIDPGKFSFAEGLVKPADFKDVDAIIITHNQLRLTCNIIAVSCSWLTAIYTDIVRLRSRWINVVIAILTSH